MACRDFLKADKAARRVGMAKDSYTVMHLDLSSLESVRQFVDNFRWALHPNATSQLIACRVSVLTSKLQTSMEFTGILPC